MAKKRRIVKYGIVACLVAMAVTACQRHDNDDNRTEEKVSPSTEHMWEKKDYSGLEYKTSYFTNPDDFNLYSVTVKLETAQVGDRQYGFMSEISEDERKRCIETTEILLDRIGFDGDLSIYVYTDEAGNGSFYIDEKDKANNLVVYETDWRSPDYVTAVLLSAYGKYANYGVAYGYANYLCDSLLNVWENIMDETDDNRKNIVSDTQSNEANYGQPVFDAQYNCYDLNLLCFDDDFVTTDEIVEAKAVSCAFVHEYIKNNGEDALRELLKKSGDVQLCHEFNTELGKWYNENGLVLSKPLSEVLYSYGGYSYQYIVYNRYAVFYMDRNWKDTYDTSLSEDFLHKNYADIKKFYEVNTEQMRKYNELFELEGSVLDVPVLISCKKRRSDEVNFTGAYYYDSKIIHLKSVTALIHEYIHALTIPSSMKQAWVTEGWAEAYECRYNYYQTNVYNYTMNNQDYIFLKEYIEKKGSPIDMAADDTTVSDLLVYGMNDYDYKQGYTSAASFFHYLSDIYGEKKIIDYVCHNHDLATVTDKSLDELAEDWKNYIENKYSQYSKM